MMESVIMGVFYDSLMDQLFIADRVSNFTTAGMDSLVVVVIRTGILSKEALSALPYRKLHRNAWSAVYYFVC